MAKIDVRTQLTLGHPMHGMHKAIPMRRGTTFEYTYYMSDEEVRSLLSQFTLLFRCGKQVRWFDMFDYFEPCEDEKVEPGCKYFKKTIDPKAFFGYRMEYQYLDVGDDIPAGSYTLIRPADDFWDDQNRSGLIADFDEHFFVDDSGIIFHLSPEETAEFPLSDIDDPETYTEFQVALKYNTDDLDYMRGRDTTEVEDEPPIVVVDSIYYKTLPYRGPRLCSNHAITSEKYVSRN